MSARGGRRKGASGTRDAILTAARRLFGEVGYERATLRAIASEAGVDPALVLHFFGSKEELFIAVVELPFDPRTVIPAVLAGEPEKAGVRLARFFLGVLDDPSGRARITSMVRAAASQPRAAEMLRDFLSRETLGPLARALGVEDAALRATLVGSQLVGVVMARHVVGVEPLASAPAETVADAIAPTLQRYLTEPLGGQARAERTPAP